MAWMVRVVDVSGTETHYEGDPPEEVEYNLMADGRWRVRVRYFDDAAPSVTLYERDFVFHAAEVDGGRALAEVQAFGRRMRDAAGLVAELSGAEGLSFPVDPD